MKNRCGYAGRAEPGHVREGQMVDERQRQSRLTAGGLTDILPDGNSPVGIYIHIPFCIKKCDYCDFLSGPATGETQSAYVQALIREIRLNRDFQDTVHQCRMKRENREGTWIGDDIEAAFLALHQRGFAVSVEAYEDKVLSGGLYGVAIGRCFFGESMFSEKENGSKAALIGLAAVLRDKDFLFIDCQFHTEHLESMGGRYVSWEEYWQMLREGTKGAD